MGLIRDIIDSVKYKRTLDKIYKEERLLSNLSQLFGTQFRKDWIGRVYAVLNPKIQNMEIETSKQIYEFMPDGSLNDNMYIEKWVMDKLNIASLFIRNNNLFDMLTYSIKRIDEYDNYLVIFEPVPYTSLRRSAKRTALWTAGLAALAAAALVTLKLLI